MVVHPAPLSIKAPTDQKTTLSNLQQRTLSALVWLVLISSLIYIEPYLFQVLLFLHSCMHQTPLTKTI